MDVRRQMLQRVDGRLRVRWGGEGDNNEKKVCFKMHFRHKKVFNQVIGDLSTLF